MRRPDAHVRNFLDCVQSRAQRPTCDIEIAHRSTNTCHLGNIAYKLGRKLDWDAETETLQERPRGQRPALARAAQGLRAAEGVRDRGERAEDKGQKGKRAKEQRRGGQIAGGGASSSWLALSGSDRLGPLPSDLCPLSFALCPLSSALCPLPSLCPLSFGHCPLWIALA